MGVVSGDPLSVAYYVTGMAWATLPGLLRCAVRPHEDPAQRLCACLQECK